MRTPTNRRSIAIRAGGAAAVATAGLLALAACSSGGGIYGGSSGASSGASTPSSSTTVALRSAGGMHVLTTSSGRTLYSSSQEDGTVLCTSGACNAIWAPLTVSGGHMPTASGGVTHLTTLARPDGTRQVAFDGRPLYTFSFDHGAGQVNGNGAHDSFDGTSFTWHAVTTTGSGSTSASGSSAGSSHGYGAGY